MKKYFALIFILFACLVLVPACKKEKPAKVKVQDIDPRTGMPSHCWEAEDGTIMCTK